MASIVSRAIDWNSAVTALPDNRHPFGQNCVMDRDIQAIMFHYGVRKQDVDVLLDEGYATLADFKCADPRATDEDSVLCFNAIRDRVKGALHQRKVKEAIIRVLSVDPLAPVITPAPALADPHPGGWAANTRPEEEQVKPTTQSDQPDDGNLPSTPRGLPIEMWTRILSYLPDYHLLRSVIPLNRFFRDLAYNVGFQVAIAALSH